MVMTMMVFCCYMWSHNACVGTGKGETLCHLQPPDPASMRRINACGLSLCRIDTMLLACPCAARRFAVCGWAVASCIACRVLMEAGQGLPYSLPSRAVVCGALAAALTCQSCCKGSVIFVSCPTCSLSAQCGQQRQEGPALLP